MNIVLQLDVLKKRVIYVEYTDENSSFLNDVNIIQIFSEHIFNPEYKYKLVIACLYKTTK